MATDNKLKAQYPLPAYNYRLTVLPASFQEIIPGSKTLELLTPVTVISCSEITGLSMEVETTVYKHGFSFVTGFQVMAGQRKEVRLSIKKGVTADGEYLSKWINRVYPFVKPLPLKRDMLVDLCDEKGDPVVRWIVVKAMPVKLEAPTFDAATDEVAFEKMDFIAHQLKIEYLNGK